MPTTDGYNGAYTGPEIDAGIARANQAITVENSGEVSMSETLGSGPYTIEFTEEAGSGGGSLPDGSAGQILGYVEDNVVGPIMSKSDLLSEETAEMYGFSEAAVPDDLFKVLVQMAGNNWYNIKVQLPDGTPVSGCQITGLTPATGSGSVVTDSSGCAFGKAANSNPSLTATSPYYDYNSVSASVPQTSAITSHTFTLTEKQLSFPIQITSSQKTRFSPKFGKVDIFLIGGGGGGAIAAANCTCSTGGAGAYRQTVNNVDFSDKEVQFTIGSGGAAVTSKNTSSINNQNGKSGGKTSVAITGGETYTANGGSGGLQVTATGNPSAVIYTQATQGGSKSALASVNNTASTKHNFEDAEAGVQAFGTGDILGSGGGAYARNDYESPAYQGGVNGARGAGSWTTNQYGIDGITWGSGGGPGNIVSTSVGSGVTCSSGAGKSGIIIIRKAVM